MTLVDFVKGAKEALAADGFPARESDFEAHCTAYFLRNKRKKMSPTGCVKQFKEAVWERPSCGFQHRVRDAQLQDRRLAEFRNADS